jgi:hypothetical protein
MRIKLIRGIDTNRLGDTIGRLMSAGWMLSTVFVKMGDPFISVIMQKERRIKK